MQKPELVQHKEPNKCKQYAKLMENGNKQSNKKYKLEPHINEWLCLKTINMF